MLILARYERWSLLVTANQPFGEWGKIFPDQAMTLAVVDRLVHHATIFEMNVESYRRRTALDRKRGPGRPPVRAQSPPTPDCRAATIKRPGDLLRDSHVATIIGPPRCRILILFVAAFSSRSPRYTARLAAEPWQGHPSEVDPTTGMDRNGQFISAFPNAPADAAGIGRTLSRGL